MKNLISTAMLSLFLCACSPTQSPLKPGGSEDAICSPNQRHCESKKE